MKDKKFAVIGCGPVGGILAASLVKCVNALALVDANSALLDVVREEGVNVTGTMNFNSHIDNLFSSVEDLKEFDPDVVIIATKTWVLPTLIPALEMIHRQGRLYVVAQNGIDNEMAVADSFGKENTLRAVINFAGNPLAPGVLKMTFFNPPNYIGILTPAAEEQATALAELMSSVDLPTVFTSDLRRHIWKKTVMNSAMNPICSLTRQTMFEVMQCEGTRTFLRRVMRETVTVANAEGFDFDEDFVQNCMAYMMKAGRHKPSMLLDVENGMPTEVDAMCGRIVQIGKKFGIYTPYNEGLAVLIHGIEASERTCKGFRIGSSFKDETGHETCGVCPYDFGQSSILSNAQRLNGRNDQ